MKSKVNFYIKLLMPVVFIATGISVLAKSKIQNLTSNESASQVSAQIFPSTGLNKHSLGIGIGQTFVAGDFGDTGEDQITWDLLYNYTASYTFDLLVDFHHSKQAFADTYTQLTSLNMGIKTKFYQIDNFSPFAVGGLGFYAPKVKRTTEEGTLQESTLKPVFGYHLGLGVDLKLNDKVAVGLYGTYHNPFDVKQEQGAQVEGRYYKLLITSFYSFQ